MSTQRPRPDEQEYDLLPYTRARKAIGDRTRQSITEKPQFWMSTQVDATALVEVRAAMRGSGADAVPSYNDYVIKVVALTLRDHPRFNAWVAEDGLHVLKHVNIGFAVATDEGVLLPAVMDADTKPLAVISEETKERINLARAGKLRASLQMGASFTISNIGPTDVDAFNAIISPPQTGILAVGSLKARPVVVGDELVARKTMTLTLSVDHAAADGADGAKFLVDVKGRLESKALLDSL